MIKTADEALEFIHKRITGEIPEQPYPRIPEQALKNSEEKKVKKIEISEINKLIDNWADDWEDPVLRADLIPHLKRTSKSSDYSLSDLKDLILTEIRRRNKLKKEEDVLKQKSEKETKEKKVSEAKQKALDEAEQKANKIFNKKSQIKNFIKQQPFLYDPNKIWYMWDNSNFRWIKVDDVELLNMIEGSTGSEILIQNERQIIINSLKQNGRKNFRNIQQPKKTWIQFKDKIVDVETGEEFTASPDYFMVNPIPWELGSSEDTPTIDKLFREWVIFEGIQDQTYVDTLYEIVAYSILPSSLLQKIICLVGVGANGKSSYSQLIEKFIGSDNCCSTEMDLLKERFENSRLYGKLVVFIGEIDKAIFKKTGSIKRLVGEDTMRIEFKGKDGFDACLYCKPIIACNNLPETTDKSLGFFRRWLIIDFLNQFDKQANILKTIPDVEFNNLAKKSVRILKELIEKGSFTNEGSFDERKKRYEERANPLDMFIQDKCKYTEKSKILFNDFFEIYSEWLKSNYYNVQSKREVGIAIQNREPRIKKRRFNVNTADGKIEKNFYIKGIEWIEQEVERPEETEEEKSKGIEV